MSKYPPVLIVDENDEPVGAAPIEEVYQKGLRHRIARVMVEDGEGNIALQKRSSTIIGYPNCWDNSAGGHVDEGESYEQAAERELLEEIGIKGELQVSGGFSTNALRDNDRIVNRFSRVYKVTVDQNVSFVVHKKEVSEVRWFSVEEAKELIENSPEAVTDGLVDIMKNFY
jgi:isopentenyl-diphosphate delta-isomerase